jgi:hypothetical protein
MTCDYLPHKGAKHAKIRRRRRILKYIDLVEYSPKCAILSLPKAGAD